MTANKKIITFEKREQVIAARKEHGFETLQYNILNPKYNMLNSCNYEGIFLWIVIETCQMFENEAAPSCYGISYLLILLTNFCEVWLSIWNRKIK